MSPKAAAVATETARQNASARRKARALKTSVVNIQFEPDRPDVDDEPSRAGRVQLATQIADLDVDDVGLRQEFEIPDILKQHRPSHDLTRAAHEILEQLEFPGQKIDRSSRAPYLPLDQIHIQVAGLQARDATVAAPAQKRLDPRGQFADVERFDEIVVAAGLQSIDPFVDGREGADDQNGRRV